MAADPSWDQVMSSSSLRDAIDRIIPVDDWPGGWVGGVGSYLAGAAAELQWTTPALLRFNAQLEATRFTEIRSAEKDLVLSRLAAGADTRPDFDVLLRLCWEGYYAQSRLPADDGKPGSWHTPAGLSMTGFREIPDGVTPIEPSLPEGIATGAVRDHYDAVVIGSGPGGGVAAQVLAAAGYSILVVERAEPYSNRQLRGDHLHGKRNAVYRSTVGPGAGHPRIAVAGTH